MRRGHARGLRLGKETPGASSTRPEVVRDSCAQVFATVPRTTSSRVVLWRSALTVCPMTDEAANSRALSPGRPHTHPTQARSGTRGDDDGTSTREGLSSPTPSGLSPGSPAEHPGPGALPEPVPLDLDEILARARVASRTTDEARASEVLRLLGNAGGFLPLDALLAQGAPRSVLARLLDDDGTDKRRRPKARVGFVADSPVVWLTATGWQAVGRPSGREIVPDRMTVQEATTPLLVRSWLRGLALDSYGVCVEVSTGRACRDFSAEVTARAWSRLRTNADADGSVGSLTGGLLPDALLVESWTGDSAASLWAQAWGSEPDRDDLSETTVLLEVETTDKRERLRSKVDRLSAVVTDLRLAQAVVWVVGSVQVRDRLESLGVGDRSRRPEHYLVPAHALGLPGDSFPTPGLPWWPLRVTAPCASGAGTDSP